MDQILSNIPLLAGSSAFAIFWCFGAFFPSPEVALSFLNVLIPFLLGWLWCEAQRGAKHKKDAASTSQRRRFSDAAYELAVVAPPDSISKPAVVDVDDDDDDDLVDNITATTTRAVNLTAETTAAVATRTSGAMARGFDESALLAFDDMKEQMNQVCKRVEALAETVSQTQQFGGTTLGRIPSFLKGSEEPSDTRMIRLTSRMHAVSETEGEQRVPTHTALVDCTTAAQPGGASSALAAGPRRASLGNETVSPSTSASPVTNKGQEKSEKIAAFTAGAFLQTSVSPKRSQTTVSPTCGVFSSKHLAAAIGENRLARVLSDDEWESIRWRMAEKYPNKGDNSGSNSGSGRAKKANESQSGVNVPA